MLIDEIKKVFSDYLKSYLSDRDFSSTFKVLSPNITGFGTGFDEK